MTRRAARAAVVQTAARTLGCRCDAYVDRRRASRTPGQRGLAGSSRQYDRSAGAEELRARKQVATPRIRSFGASSAISARLEPPVPAEGFSRIDDAWRSTASAIRRSTDRALIVWCDGVLMRSRAGWRTPVLRRRPRRARWTSEALLATLCATTGRRISGCPGSRRSPRHADRGTMPNAVFAGMRARLGVDIEVELYCPHAAGPPACWCRKPLPGLGVPVQFSVTGSIRGNASTSGGPRILASARRLGLQYPRRRRILRSGARTSKRHANPPHDPRARRDAAAATLIRLIQDGEAHGDPPYLLEDGWEPLLNGRDLTGWRACDATAKSEWFTTQVGSLRTDSRTDAVERPRRRRAASS